MKALVGAFNQEKALVGAFSVIVKTGCGTDGSFYSTTRYSLLVGRSAAPPLARSLPSIHSFSGNLVMVGTRVAHFVHLHKITFIDATGPEFLIFCIYNVI